MKLVNTEHAVALICVLLATGGLYYIWRAYTNF